MSKKVIFTAVYAAVILLSICLLSESVLLVGSRIRGLDTSIAKLISQREAVFGDLKFKKGTVTANTQWEGSLKIHPFFGYVYNPELGKANNFGFKTKYDIYISNGRYSVVTGAGKRPLTIGIFGGSFADVMGKDSAYLEKRVASLFPDRAAVVINFGIGGHALPQALYIFTYFSDLLDVAVFIDGLNEVWNPITNNMAGCPPEYAKAVHYTHKLSANDLSPETFTRTGVILMARKGILFCTKLSLVPVLRRSLAVHHIWVVCVNTMNRIICINYLAIENIHRAHGKFYNISDEDILDFAIRHWGDYHRMIHDIARSKNILDIHLIQPNPFVKGSKHLTKGERKSVDKFNEAIPIKDSVERGYPGLRQAAADLKASGLLVEDLSYIFKDVESPIWTDSCHANSAGSKMVLNKVAELIGENYRP